MGLCDQMYAATCSMLPCTGSHDLLLAWPLQARCGAQLA